MGIYHRVTQTFPVSTFEAITAVSDNSPWAHITAISEDQTLPTGRTLSKLPTVIRNSLFHLAGSIWANVGANRSL